MIAARSTAAAKPDPSLEESAKAAPSAPVVDGHAKTAFPNLAGVATQDLVQTIGTGKFSASYINWARTQNLLHEHAPGWAVEVELAADGGLVHRAPVGGFLLLRYRHIDGTVTPWAPQAIMDARNNAIPLDKIDARDVSDTHRRGSCMAAALFFGLAMEMWAKLPLESGYSDGADTGETPARATVQPATVGTPAASKEDFLKAAAEKGLTTFAAEALVGKLKGNFAGGIKALKAEDKDADWVNSFNEQSAPKSKEGENW